METYQNASEWKSCLCFCRVTPSNPSEPLPPWCQKQLYSLRSWWNEGGGNSCSFAETFTSNLEHRTCIKMFESSNIFKNHLCHVPNMGIFCDKFMAQVYGSHFQSLIMLKMGLPKRKVLFQASISMLLFFGGKTWTNSYGIVGLKSSSWWHLGMTHFSCQVQRRVAIFGPFPIHILKFWRVKNPWKTHMEHPKIGGFTDVTSFSKIFRGVKIDAWKDDSP